jgi:LysM repeat protein
MRLKSSWLGRLAFVTLSIILVLAFLAAAAPQAAAATCKFKHKVKAGESVIIIANLYQTDWREIVEANDLKEPYALTVGQVLCIPNGTAPASEPSTGTEETGEPKLTGVPSFMHVLVVVENYPIGKVFNVRVGDGPSGDPRSTFFLVGRLKTNKNGDYEGYFRLPRELQVAGKLEVCLKDPFTDKTYCSGYDNPFNYVMALYYRCAKPGR